MTIARRLPSAVQATLLSGAALAVAACNASAGLVQKAPDGPHRVQAVSYTHLTLPTKA